MGKTSNPFGCVPIHAQKKELFIIIFRQTLSQLLITIPAALLALTIHEMAHGYVAYFMGDHTAKMQGRLTLNPLHHLDPIGFLCILIAGFGWAKPVPVNPRNFKHPRGGMALTALAGPAANILMSFLFGAGGLLLNFYVHNSIANAIGSFMQYTALLSASLAVFNLIPVPPLDGSKLILPFLPNDVQSWFFNYQDYIRFVFLILIIFHLLDGIILSGSNLIMNGVYSFSLWLLRLTGMGI